MIVDKKILHTGTLGDTDRTEMTFDTNSIAHLMSVLTDLYSDPRMAIIREYSSNARDSHAAAGIERAIEIELPTVLRPTFIVRDFGTGMSLDTITNQFSKYGWSSKRETNDQVGMLGLGCKCALSYTSQFTMVSNHNGLKITVLVTRTPEGAGAVQIVDTVPTEDTNGVEVRIPANEGTFDEKARFFFQFWEAGQVLIDGKEPELIATKPSVLILDPDLYMTDWLDSCYIVMGNVPYPVQRGKILNGEKKNGVVARVPIGSVNFVPSREALHYTKLTDETIASINEFVVARLKTRVQETIDAATTHVEAHATFLSLTPMLDVLRRNTYHARGWQEPTYRGERFPQYFNFDERRTLMFNASRYNSKESSDRITTLDYKRARNVMLWVTGHAGNHVTAATKERARIYCQQKGWADREGRSTAVVNRQHGIVCLPAMLTGEWLGAVNVVTWTELKAIKLSDEVAKAVKVATAYTVLDRYGAVADPSSGYPTEIIKRNGGLACWIEAGDPQFMGIKATIGRFAGEYLCANVPKRSVEKFKRDNPDLPTLMEYLATRTEELLASANPWQRYWAQERYSGTGGLDEWFKTSSWKPERIADPEMRDIILGFRQFEKASRLDLWDSVVQLHQLLGLPVPKLSSSGLLPKIGNIIHRYPLIPNIMHQLTGRVGKQNAIYSYLNNEYMVRNSFHCVPVML